MSFNQKFLAGESYGDERKSSASFFNDPAKIAADLLRDYAGLRSQITPAEIVGLVKELLSKGEPLDDKKG
jgi:linoleate 10R-lipoxygenase